MVQKLTLDEVGVDPSDAGDVIYGLRREVRVLKATIVKDVEDRNPWIYATSKNTGPTWTGSDPVTLVYLGTSVEEAEVAVGNFTRYAKTEDKFPVNFLHIYSAIPRNYVEWELIQYYMADGWWYSIVRFQLGGNE